MSSYLRRLLDLSHSLNSIGLCGNCNKLRLLFSSIREKFNVPHTGSRDTKLAGAGIDVRTGWKCRATETVQQAESRLKHKVLLGSVAQIRAGLGSQTSTQYNTASGKERRKLVHASVEEE